MPKQSNQSEKKQQLPKVITIAVAAIALLFLLIWQFLSKSSNPDFSGENAYQYLVKQCEFGPRNAGSAGHEKCKEFLITELKEYCDRVLTQEFDYQDKHNAEKIYHGTNIIGSINLNPKKRKRIMLCAHWDTRPWADEDPDSSNHDHPIIGANDGASGVAVLLEMARILKDLILNIGVDIILFDLEDLGDHQAEQYPDSLNPFSIGSTYFADHNTAYRPDFGILIDMVADNDLQIKKEAYSKVNAEPIVNKVWAAAKEANASAFVDLDDGAIMDDHVPFLKRGIQVIDLIDFDYPYWHTLEDTPDKCSAQSLQQIGDVLLGVIRNE